MIQASRFAVILVLQTHRTWVHQAQRRKRSNGIRSHTQSWMIVAMQSINAIRVVPILSRDLDPLGGHNWPLRSSFAFGAKEGLTNGRSKTPRNKEAQNDAVVLLLVLKCLELWRFFWHMHQVYMLQGRAIQVVHATPFVHSICLLSLVGCDRKFPNSPLHKQLACRLPTQILDRQSVEGLED